MEIIGCNDSRRTTASDDIALHQALINNRLPNLVRAATCSRRFNAAKSLFGHRRNIYSSICAFCTNPSLTVRGIDQYHTPVLDFCLLPYWRVPAWLQREPSPGWNQSGGKKQIPQRPIGRARELSARFHSNKDDPTLVRFLALKANFKGRWLLSNVAAVT